MGKDGRMHGVIRDPELQERIKERQKLENISFEELINRYLTFPEDAQDFLSKEHATFTELVIKVYQKPKLRELMTALWILVIKSAKGEYDIDRILHNVKADIELGTYKKRGS